MFDIIIVTHNAKDKLERCIRSIKRNTENYKLTVLDNNSRDGTRRYLKSLKGVNTIFSRKNLGFCGGVNLALKQTENEFVVLLDDDTEVTEGWLDGLYSQMRGRPRVGIVGCKIVFSDNRLMSADYRVKPLYLVGAGEIDRGQRDYVKESDALVGTCWLLRRALIGKVGYFDERFFPCQHEDIDYCLRARLAGYRIIYNGKVKVIHHNLYRDGGEKLGRRNWQRFLKKWKHTLDKFPLKDSHPADRCMARGNDYLCRSKPGRALLEFRKAALYDRRFSEPIYEGLALTNMERFADAIRQFKRAERLKPYDLTVNYYLSIVYRKTKRIEKAKDELTKILPHLFSYKNRCFTE